MPVTNTEDASQLHVAAKELHGNFPVEYWREIDQRREYPKFFADALTEAAYLAVLIPEQSAANVAVQAYGG